MANLSPLDIERLKLLLSGKSLSTGEKVSTLDLLRSRFPDFLSNPAFNLTEENLKDNNFLIKFLSNPYNRDKIKDALRKELSLSSTQRVEIEESLKEPATTGVASSQPSEQAASTQQSTPIGPTNASAGGMPFEMPSIPSAPSMPRVYNIPHTPEPPKPEIAIANKSGAVVEAPPSEFHTADKSGNITATYSKNPTPAAEAPQSRLVNSRGDIIGERPAGLQTQPKIVTANSSGALKGLGGEAPTKQIFMANKSGIVTGVQNIKSPSWLKTAGSNIKIFAKTNLGRIGRGITGAVKKGLETANPFLGRMGNKLANGLSSIARPGGMGGTGSRSILGRFGKGGGGKGSLIGKAKGRGALVFVLSTLGFMLLTGFTAITAPTSTPTSTPDGTTPTGSPVPPSSGTPPAGNFDYYANTYGFNSVNGSDYGFAKPREHRDVFNQAKEKAIKWAPAFGVSPVLIVWWDFFETGNRLDSYSYSNCRNVDFDVNNNCSSTASGNWQLGYGQQYGETVGILKEAFQMTHPSQSVQEVGQNVLDKAGQTTHAPFSNVYTSIDDLIADHTTSAQYWKSVLMRDPDISAYLLAFRFSTKFNGSGFGGKTEVLGWDGKEKTGEPIIGYYHNNWQAASNLLNDILIEWDKPQ